LGDEKQSETLNWRNREVEGLQQSNGPVYLTHELNTVTEPLLRTRQIDYLIVQHLDEIIRRTTRFMREIPGDAPRSHILEDIPFRLVAQFNIG
jgi:hypothetical protein